MIVAAQVAAAPPPAAGPAGAVASGGPVGPVLLTRHSCPADTGTGEVVVCGRKDPSSFRPGPEPAPPPADNLLSRPLRLQIAPGVTFGFHRGGGFGLRTEFGPGRKSGEDER